MTDKIKLKADKFVNDKKLNLNYIKPKDLKLLLTEFCEEQIAELKAECDLAIEGRDVKINELEHQLTHRNCVDCSNHLSKLKMKVLELEKENAELKEELQKWKDEWQEQVQKATDEGYARTLQTMQLSKAKEIIRKLLSAYTTYADSFDDRDNEIVEEAMQFLKENEECQ